MMKKLIPFYFVNVAYQQSMYVRFILHANISVGTVNCASKARIPRIFLFPERFWAVSPGKNVYLLEKMSILSIIISEILSDLRKTTKTVSFFGCRIVISNDLFVGQIISPCLAQVFQHRFSVSIEVFDVLLKGPYMGIKISLSIRHFELICTLRHKWGKTVCWKQFEFLSISIFSLLPCNLEVTMLGIRDLNWIGNVSLN